MQKEFQYSEDEDDYILAPSKSWFDYTKKYLKNHTNKTRTVCKDFLGYFFVLYVQLISIYFLGMHKH